MRIAILSDSWKPLVNGVVTTLSRLMPALEQKGHQVRLIHPQLFQTAPCPTYPEIRLALFPFPKLTRLLDDYKPDAIHITIEGPIGIAGRWYCFLRKVPFTTSFTTRFPEDVQLRLGIPAAPIYRPYRWFHSAAARTSVGTPSLRRELQHRGFDNLVIWGRGVDHHLFKPGDKAVLNAPGPISLYLGRVAVEKNLEAFLALDIPGTKVIIGDGPDLPKLKKSYPRALFLGTKSGEDLVRHLNAADVFVFPSLTDTFGIVMLEAMACGLPVAAYPVVGPQDLVVSGRTGWLDRDLRIAVEKALTMRPEDCRQHALQYTWENCFAQFLSMLAPIPRNGKGSK